MATKNRKRASRDPGKVHFYCSTLNGNKLCWPVELLRTDPHSGWKYVRGLAGRFKGRTFSVVGYEISSYIPTGYKLAPGASKFVSARSTYQKKLDGTARERHDTRRDAMSKATFKRLSRNLVRGDYFIEVATRGGNLYRRSSKEAYDSPWGTADIQRMPPGSPWDYGEYLQSGPIAELRLAVEKFEKKTSGDRIRKTRRDPTSAKTPQGVARHIAKEMQTRPMMPAQLVKDYGLTLAMARQIYDYAPYAYGPGGLGEAWYERRILGVLEGKSVPYGRDFSTRSTSGHLWRKGHEELLALGYTYLSHGHYKVTDKEAGRLARDAGRKLPSHGYELSVVLPNGEKAWLLRTPLRYPAPPLKPSKRGWVWAVHVR